jgi:hypothetical protein
MTFILWPPGTIYDLVFTGDASCEFWFCKEKINNNYNYNTELHFRQTDTDVLFTWYLHQVYIVLPSKHTLNFKHLSTSTSNSTKTVHTVSWIAMWHRKLKVKCTLVQALRLCTGRTAHSGSSGIALPFHDHGSRRGWGVSFMPRPLFTPGKDPVPIVQEAGWAPGTESVAPTRIRSPDRPARSQSIYRLSYPARMWHRGKIIFPDNSQYII